jgi:hypothetical protein
MECRRRGRADFSTVKREMYGPLYHPLLSPARRSTTAVVNLGRVAPDRQFLVSTKTGALRGCCVMNSQPCAAECDADVLPCQRHSVCPRQQPRLWRFLLLSLPCITHCITHLTAQDGCRELATRGPGVRRRAEHERPTGNSRQQRLSCEARQAEAARQRESPEPTFFASFAEVSACKF